MKTILGLMILMVAFGASAQTDLGRWKQRWLNDYLTNQDCIWPNFYGQPAFNICVPDGYMKHTEDRESGWLVRREHSGPGEAMLLYYWQPGWTTHKYYAFAVQDITQWDPPPNQLRSKKTYWVSFHVDGGDFSFSPVLKKDASALAKAFFDHINTGGVPPMCRTEGSRMRLTYMGGVVDVETGRQRDTGTVDGGDALVDVGNAPRLEYRQCREYN